MKVARCQNEDFVTISKLCVHYYLDLSEIHEIHYLSSSEIGFHEKFQLFRTLLNIDNDQILGTDRILACKLANLLSDMICSNSGTNENLLLVAKLLKISLKQIFHLISPELFYQLLVVGGKLYRAGSDLSKVLNSFF